MTFISVWLCFSKGQAEGLPNPLKISALTWFSANDSDNWA